MLIGWLQYPSHVRAMIPEKIETVEVVSNDFSEQFGGGGDCGGLTFRLSKKTLTEINAQGLDYFKDATFPIPEIDYDGKKDRWNAWRKAPPAAEYHGANILDGECLDDFEEFLNINGYEIKSDTKGYYTFVTHRGYSNMWIFPQWGIIAYSYYY